VPGGFAWAAKEIFETTIVKAIMKIVIEECDFGT
jgi:hypothetical protein